MNSKLLLCLAFFLSGELFDWDIVAPTIITLILLSIPISAAVRLIMAQVSPRVRQSICRHPILHLLWLAVAIAVIVLPFLLPPLR